MSETFDVVAKVISDTTEIPLDKITPEAHAIDDLGIDSLDFLDIVFALDKKFGIKIPLEAWTQEVNQGRAKVEDYFVLKNLCARIDELEELGAGQDAALLRDDRAHDVGLGPGEGAGAPRRGDHPHRGHHGPPRVGSTVEEQRHGERH